MLQNILNIALKLVSYLTIHKSILKKLKEQVHMETVMEDKTVSFSNNTQYFKLHVKYWLYLNGHLQY